MEEECKLVGHCLRTWTTEQKEKKKWVRLVAFDEKVSKDVLSITKAGREIIQYSSVQSLSRVRLFATPWIAAHQASLSITNSRSSLRLTSIESVMPSNCLILCRPLLLLPPIPPSIRVFSNESTLHMRWPKSTGVSALASFPPKKSQGWSPSEWIGWISLQAKGLSRVFSNITFKSSNSSVLSFLHSPTLTSIHDHWKNHSLD